MEQEFEKYVAAVEMASLASGGSGELNNFDHVAKDLYQEGFDALFDEVPQWKRNVFRSNWEPLVRMEAAKKYRN